MYYRNNCTSSWLPTRITRIKISICKRLNWINYASNFKPTGS